MSTSRLAIGGAQAPLLHPLFAGRDSRTAWRRWGGLALVAAVHVAAAYGLMQMDVVRQAIMPATPIMVSFVPAEVRELVREPAAAKPPEPRKAATATPVPQRSVVPTPLPAADVPATTPAPTQAMVAAPTTSAPVAEAPAPISAPLFNAAYLHNPAPAYPLLSRRMGEQGNVRLRVFVSAAGQAETVEIESTSGSPRLDRAALDAVRNWRFVPARQGDRPLAAWVVVPILFQLGD
jgi:protein TonB